MKENRFDQTLIVLNKSTAQTKARMRESWDDSLTRTLPEQINSDEESDA